MTDLRTVPDVPNSSDAARILESVSDAFFALDSAWRFTYVNAQAGKMLSRRREDLMGKSIWEEFPEAVGSTFEHEYRRAVNEQVSVTFEAFSQPFSVWFEVRAFPSSSGLSVFFYDITDRVERRRGEQFLADLAERARAITDPDKVIADAVRSVGEFLGVSRCIFADIDIEADTCTVHPDYCADSSVASIEGVVPISAFGAHVVAEYAARRAVVVDDVRLDPIRAPEASLAAYEAINIRAHVTVPVVHFDRIVSCISLHNALPRHWKPSEVELLRAVVERTWLTVEVLRQQRALVRGAEATARTLDALTDAFFTLDREFRFTFVNRQAEAMWGMTRAELVGRSAWEVFPDSVGGVFYHQYHRVMAGGTSESVEDFYPKLDAWLDVRAMPSPDGISVFFQNVTVRKNLERRERFLADLAERARALTDPDKVIEDALRSVGEFLGVSRCIFADIDIEADTCTGHPDYRADESVVSMAGVFPISAFGEVVIAAYGAGCAVAVDDVHLDRVQVPEDNIAAYDSVGIRAHASVPVVHSDRLVSCIGAHSAVPRHWKLEEVELLRAVVERTWLTVEVTRQEHALVREAEERREEAERTARTLESISDAFFTLDREWRYTYINRQVEVLWGRGRAELLGRIVWETWPEAVGTPFDEHFHRAMREGVAISFEEFFPPLDAWLEVRISPSPAGLSVFFQNVNARKRAEEERERLAERERNIAQQLQAALTPAVPERIPGLLLANHYKAALEEAGVGGDFYDVFPVDKGCTALVVGDLSGKGLAAATQVATVRNMLRYALYRARTLAGGIEGLNALLAEQSLLTGFCTLFVGTFDSSTGTLTYVNCGQEPALVRRARTSRVELLPPTGPVLGSFEGAVFGEQEVALRPGDALVVFTDGLTEVGKSRKEMLGIEGVTDLLARLVVSQDADSAEAAADHLVRDLITGVDAAAQEGVMRDDVCLLVGIVE